MLFPRNDLVFYCLLPRYCCFDHDFVGIAQTLTPLIRAIDFVRALPIESIKEKTRWPSTMNTKNYNTDSTRKNLYQRGHIELGVTLAIIIIMGMVAYLEIISEGEPVAMWLGWPWWAKALSIIVPIALLLIGRIFENSRQWPKL